MNEIIFFFFYNLAHQNVFFDDLVIFFAIYFPYVVIFLAGVFLIMHHEVFKAESTSQVRSLFPETGYAFPSGHATFFMALALSIFFFHKKAGFIFMFFTLIIGLARIIAGVHFPIDILGGFILGALVALLIKKTN